MSFLVQTIYYQKIVESKKFADSVPGLVKLFYPIFIFEINRQWKNAFIFLLIYLLLTALMLNIFDGSGSRVYLFAHVVYVVYLRVIYLKVYI